MNDLATPAAERYLLPQHLHKASDAYAVFAHQTLKHDHVPRLRHQLTDSQFVEQTELVRKVEYLQCLEASDNGAEDVLRAARAGVDQSYLSFCMSLLDHTLNGDT